MKQEIKAAIERFVRNYPERQKTATLWETPLTGFAAADDPLFDRLKSAVGPTHAMPQDLLKEARTVIAFFLPFLIDLAKTNKKGRDASREWAIAYLETNRLIHDLSEHLKQFLESRGHAACLMPATHNFDPKRLKSDWSHRHVADIAGLGRFGFNNMMITDKGCCGRIGSLITSLAVEADARPEGEACLYRLDGTCLKCVDRCVNDALLEDRFDRFKCHEMCLQNEKLHLSLGKADVCGKCLVTVPCSHRIPKKKKT
ncbi:MAG: 4Fe-4S binding protein [Planctomycetota bacterium]|jgi:epoxyqueuosine reductase QueG